MQTTHSKIGKILVVDDQSANIRVVSALLERHGYAVDTASNGKDALACAEASLPDLVLLDMMMPGMDGFELLQALQQMPGMRGVPSIFLTAAQDRDLLLRAFDAGAVDYVTKPFNFEEVRIRLHLHLPPRRSDGLADSHAEDDEAHPAASASNLDIILFQSARQHLIENIAATPNLEQLARQLRTHPKRLNEAFRHCVGATVFSYLREERMRQACALLADTSLGVQTIALELGFTSGANFATAFRERFGLTPLQFRQSRSGCLAD